MTIQIIQKQPLIFQCEFGEFEFCKPYYLIPTDEFKMIKAKVKGSTLGWGFRNEFLSINQLKKEYKK
jgi:hypothetical protein